MLIHSSRIIFRATALENTRRNKHSAKHFYANRITARSGHTCSYNCSYCVYCVPASICSSEIKYLLAERSKRRLETSKTALFFFEYDFGEMVVDENSNFWRIVVLSLFGEMSLAMCHAPAVMGASVAATRRYSIRIAECLFLRVFSSVMALNMIRLEWISIPWSSINRNKSRKNGKHARITRNRLESTGSVFLGRFTCEAGHYALPDGRRASRWYSAVIIKAKT